MEWNKKKKKILIIIKKKIKKIYVYNSHVPKLM